jgi:two-component system, OmpR family, phosphate regulon sensor histidine kinase PhoR
MRIRWRLPLVLAVTTLVFAGIVALASALILRDVFLDRLQDDMARQAYQYAAVLETAAGWDSNTGMPVGSDTATLQDLTRAAGVDGEVRFTLIARDGTVLADSEADPANLDNHADRPEVAQALAGNEGRERRQSATLKQEEVYVAVPLPTSEAAWSEGVLRAALPAARIDAMLQASWLIPLIAWAILLLPTLAVAYFLTRSITRPIERLQHMTSRVAAGELDYRTSVCTKDELGDLAGSLNDMAAQLEVRAGQLGAEMERSGQVLASMSEGVLLMDAGGRLLRSNPAAGKILGADLQGIEGTPLVLAARSFPAQALARKAQEAEGAITEVLELPGGRSLSVEVIPLQSTETKAAGAPSRGAPHPFGGQTLFVIRDETARRATERMRRDFATNVSHELKTPLAGLSLLADTLGHAVREDPEQAEKFVDRLSTEIGRLTDLVNDLLTLSRLEEPGISTESAFAEVDLVPLATETVAEVRPLAKAKHHELTVDTPATVVVIGDEVALRTLIRNLLDNAVRYTEPEGHIVLELHVQAAVDGRDRVVLSVRDDGVGIPQADQQRIFERFYRVDKARSRETGGTGLGLSIVRHVAERHGGRVEVESTVGVGSTFTVTLPGAPTMSGA